jgi:hypothetical protein
MISSAGHVTRLAGTTQVTGTTDGTVSMALFNNPQGVAVDNSGNVYVADTGNQTVRKIASGMVTTLAGKAGINGYADGAGTAVIFNAPTSVAVDSAGNVYIADLYNFVVRKISPLGVVTTPYGQPGLPGRIDGIGNGALFNAPIGLAIDSNDNLYVCDSQIAPQVTLPDKTAVTLPSTGNNLVRRITPAGVVSTIAGSGATGSADGTGNGASFYSLQALAINNSDGVVYLADTFNQTLRVGGTLPVVTTVQGTQTVTAGHSVTFSVSATGSGADPLTYQWSMNGTPISGATGASYTIASVSSGDAGTYEVTIADDFGHTNSSNYILTVSQPVPALPLWAFIVLPALLFLAAARFLPKWQRAC